MTKTEKKKLRAQFLKAAGVNAEAFAELFDLSDDLGFYIKDREGRIIWLNRRNREICNIRDEWDAIGMKSSDLFPSDKAASYMETDREVLKSKCPVRGVVSKYPADDSRRFELRDVFPLKNASGRVIGTVCAYRLTAETDSVADRYRNVRTISDYIQDHYSETLTISSLAARAGMSESSFVRAFHAVFSLSPGRYITITRLNAARRLLEDSDSLLSEIALECGFCDQSHFCRVFKAMRGLTPGEYRRRHRIVSRTIHEPA